MKQFEQTLTTLRKCRREIHDLRGNFQKPDEETYKRDISIITQQIYTLMNTIITFAEEDEK